MKSINFFLSIGTLLLGSCANELTDSDLYEGDTEGPFSFCTD